MADERTVVGRRGEEAAAAWYEARGYRVLARNWRCARGEIDLICEWADARRVSVLVVCEVKSRSSGSFGHALEAVTSGKRRRLRGLAVSYLRSQRRGYDEIRFDVVGVTPAGLVVVEGAF